MRKVWMTSAIVSALGLAGAGEAQAQSKEGEAGEFEVAQSEAITVTATRTEHSIFAVPATVSVIDSEEIEDNLASDIKNLIRFEPGVAVRASPSRFTAALASTGRDGNSGFNIRGLEGNRVHFQVDGVRLPDAFSFGPASFGRGDYVDLDLLKSVEIVRGPSSALYGSDGLAGSVSFITKDPEDFLAPDGAFGARVRAAYGSADESWAEGLSAAARAGALSGLIAYTRRDGHEQDNQGDDESPDSRRTAPNPQDVESNAFLARAVFNSGADHTYRLSYDYSDRSLVTEALTARAPPPVAPATYASTAVIDLDGLDESERQRVSFDHRFEHVGFIEKGFWALYYQDAQLLQFSDEDRFTAADRTRRTTFDNNVWGFAAQGESGFDLAGARHRLVYGGDYSSTHQEGVRDGTTPPFGESFPTRAFPNTDYALAGAFVQDEIALMEGALTLFPALRYDAYELEPEADALYTLPTAGQSDAHLSPKLGIVAWPTERFGAFFNYAAGFKAPAPSQVNNGFANPTVGYTSIANPDLKPETSDSYEFGVRLRDAQFAGAQWSASATAFTGQYEDFIEQILVSGSFTPADPGVFQYVNLSEVEITGWEARADGAWDNGLDLIVSASYSEGDQTTGAVSAPLESIEPWKLVAGLTYDAPDDRFGGQFILTHSSGKENDRAAAGAFTPPSFTVLDITAYWRVSDGATLRAGAFNVTDEKYWWWSDVRGLAASSTIRDAFTQPGANFSASVSYRF